MKQFDTIHHWTGRLIAADPGHSRLKGATKTTASLILSIVTTLLVLHVTGNVFIIPVIISGMVGMMGTVIVMDDTLQERKVTTPLIGVSAAFGITVGSFLAEKSIVIDGLMMLIIFGSFYFSKFGSRYFSLGQIAFMTIYFGVVMKLPLEQLPMVYTGILIGVTYAYLFNFKLFQDSAPALKKSMRSFHIQTNLTFNILIQGILEKDLNSKRRKSIENNVRKLRIYARTVSGNLHKEDIQKLWPGLTQSQLRTYVFDTGMLIETLTESFQKLKKADALEIVELRRLLAWVMTALRDADINSDQHNLEEAELAIQALRNVIDELKHQQEEPMKWIFLIRRIESIAIHIVEGGKSIQQGIKGGIAPKDAEDSKEEETDSHVKKDEKTPGEFSPAAKKAIQALIAGNIAIIVGKFISPIQPYWVLLTAFICLLGTESIGRTYRKGFQRTSGTIIGAAIGFFMANLFGGNTIPELIILFLVVFLSNYTATVSYTLMSAFITMMIAFMYDMLLGGVGLSLIWARIIDTVAGAAIAYTVSFIIFPKRTREKVAEVSDSYLAELKPFLISYIKRFHEEVSVKELTSQAFTIDNKLQMIEDQAQPLLKKTEAHKQSKIAEWVAIFTSINYYARQLIASSYRKDFDFPDELTTTFQQMEVKLEHNIDTLSSLINGERQGATVYMLDEERKQLEQLAPDHKQDQYDLIHHVYYIWRINQSIMKLGTDLGASRT
ncbi:FUSC family protein [Virgibacillus siamensis]|uniref:FUSC family protein n=1 Tax=Virgibacillus siamensis TaxID=480071 RepID=UPI00158A43D4|nr:FUSC family protein [Virgibacillus siamensis]